MGRGVLVAGGLGLSVVLLVTAAIGGLAVIAVLGIAGGRFGCGPDGGLGGGAQSVDGVEWTGEQTENAATIVARVVERQLPRRAAVIALSTVIVESRLVNVAYGDRDSLGLYQQRPSQGWGPPARCSTRSRPPTPSSTASSRCPDGTPWHRGRRRRRCSAQRSRIATRLRRARPQRWSTNSGWVRTIP
ncbi:hypothetical protein [Pseudonocardia sp. ICBG601]|uniref:hypothetical protein n=1 Tax=Pseudonocardia sp. ICBG601 TaxID=2846759 RepID=UPI001CF63D4F|nr:hypothetical protein [Pseudonocardia sp. ICBG601]